MENANPFIPVPPNRLHTKITQELNELRAISAMINSHLRNIDHTRVTMPPNQIDIDDLKSEDELIDTPLVSLFFDSDDGSDDGEVLNDLDDAFNTIMVEGLESTGRNLVAIVRDVYVFVGSFIYVTDFVVLEDIGEFIVSDMTDVVMGRPFRVVTQLVYDCVKGLISFGRIFDTYIFQMSRTIPRLKNFEWSKVPPILELSQRDLMSGLRFPYEKKKLMYNNNLNLGPEYQVDESMKEWLTHGHVSLHEITGRGLILYQAYGNLYAMTCMLNKKRRTLNVRGVLVDGSWIDNPIDVKDEFFNHFSTRFRNPDPKEAYIDMDFPNVLSQEDRQFIEREVFIDEIKKAVWDCGTDKAPGPDGFTFGFYRRYWDLIHGEVTNAV
nr:RNA-directed DNA polymerase, eukaryota [Tanacetum cinerariifolium]